MAHPNSAELAEAVPQCVSGCFNIGVAATGCSENDFGCWCYEKNHQTVVDTMSQCLDNRERKLKELCSDDEMFQMENSYWKICEQYWEPYGTATEPSSKATAVPKSTLTSSLRVSSTASVTELSQNTAGPSESADSDTSRETESVSSQSRGPSTGAQAGIGIGIALGVILVAVAVLLWLRERRQRHKLPNQLQEAREQKLSNEGIVIYEKGGLYEMEGDRPHCEELRGSMRTPELPASKGTSTRDEKSMGNPGEDRGELNDSLGSSKRPQTSGARSSRSSKGARFMSWIPGASREDLNVIKRDSP